ncbi:hypothetical protein [Luteimonas granuli]|uniref:RHS repeat protein n=1 Tax=Luteimonas granuli TaxID=1176533 RepID=A0A518N2B8_9GAMM|nr:hypothetical protein [Luteimonas granuli]QDW66081.1 hypothetical protein FPZ22_03550 [Luteimonas granuli]
MRDRIRHGRAGARTSAQLTDGLAATALLAVIFAATPALASKYPWQEFEQTITSAREIQTLGPDLFGDQVSLQDGALSFSATDVSIPGNDALPVEFRRTYSLFNREYHDSDEMLADWEVDVPRISGTYAPNWVDSTGSIAGRCSTGGVPPSVQSPYDTQPSETVMAYWQGLQLQIPGKASGELMPALPGTPAPSSGSYPWVTNDLVRVACLTGVDAVANEPGSGEGFVAVAPDGTRYWFTWMAQYYLPGSKQVSPPPILGLGGIQWVFPRRKNVLYATRVEDRLGNWVTYAYANTWNVPGRLTEINASDGRKITIAYSGNRIASVTATATDGPARTWTYAYGSTGSGRSTLASVTLPDATQWLIDFSQFTNAEIKYLLTYPPGEVVRTCDGLEQPQNASLAPVGTITHPSGATGIFSASIQEHGRTNVPYSCANVWVVSGGGGMGNDPNDDVNLFTIMYQSFALRSKQVSGPGVTPATWSYTYHSPSSIHMYPGTTWASPICIVGAQCYQPPCTDDACAGTSQTTVAGPEGQWERYTFGNSFRYNEGKLLRVETGSGPSDILRTVRHSYDYARAGRPYPVRFGSSLRVFTDSSSADYIRPLISTVTTQQGRDFFWQVDAVCAGNYCFDDYVRPTHVTRGSSPSP